MSLFGEDGRVVVAASTASFGVDEASEPTMALRWIERDGKRVLQQQHLVKTFVAGALSDVRPEWRDVQIELAL